MSCTGKEEWEQPKAKRRPPPAMQSTIRSAARSMLVVSSSSMRFSSAMVALRYCLVRAVMVVPFALAAGQWADQLFGGVAAAQAGVGLDGSPGRGWICLLYTHLRAHETDSYLVCRLLL